MAQGLAPSAKSDLKVDNRSAQALYEDANGYLGRKYQDFNKQKLPYDPKLEAQTKKEQQDLAVKNAAILQSRSSLKAETFITSACFIILPATLTPPSPRCGNC